MADKKQIIFPFPIKGVNEAFAYDQQPEGTTPDALNVRAYDAIGQRQRGGQRNGTSKYITTAVNGTFLIQNLSQLTTAFDSTTVVPNSTLFLDTFSYANGVLPTNGIPTFTYTRLDSASVFVPSVVTTASASVPLVESSKMTTHNSPNTGHTHMAYLGSNPSVGALYTLSCKVAAVGNTSGTQAAGFIVRGSGLVAGVLPINQWLGCYITGMSANAAGMPNVVGFAGTALATQGYPATFWTVEHLLELRVNGNVFSLYIDGALVQTATNAALAVNSGIGVAITAGASPASSYITVDDFRVQNAIVPASLRTTRLIAVSGGSIYQGNLLSGLSVPIGGAAALQATASVRSQQAYGKMYFVDGLAYKRYDPTMGQVTTWTPTAGSLPTAGGATATMIALYRGRIVLSGLSSDPQNWFMSKVGDPLDWNYTPTTITQTMAVAGNNSTAGLMGDVITCIAPYNDDLMFMGGDHTLWLMRGDPAAGGLIDNISYQTGIVGPDAWARSPDGDFFFFGAGTLWQIPSGSTVPQPLSRNVLDRTFGAIDYATFNVRLFWDDIAKGVHLYFTPASQPSSAPRHYFWDKRAGGFWPDEYPIPQGPTAVWLYDADLPTDRAFLIGGFDSYIRQLPSAVQKDDDGTPIHSRVRYAPNQLGGDLQNVKLSELTAILSDNSDPVALRVFSADSSEDAATTTTPQVSKILSAGRNSTMRQKVTGNATLIELEGVVTAWVTATYYASGVQVTEGGLLYTCLLPHTSGVFATDLAAADWILGSTRSWAAEAITGVIEVGGKVRHRRM